MKFKLTILVMVVMLFSVFIGCSTVDGVGNNNTLPSAQPNVKFNTIPEISIVAEIEEDSLLGNPNLRAEITNNSNKDIAAIRFYVQLYDVYGELITSILDANKLYTDDTIISGKTKVCVWSFFDKKIKSIDLYVYSIYYVDGTEWGDRDATKSVILNNAYKMSVN